jgi:hypothetical protein
VFQLRQSAEKLVVVFHTEPFADRAQPRAHEMKHPPITLGEVRPPPVPRYMVAQYI